VQTVRSKDKIKVITVRTSTFQATPEGGSAPVEAAAAAADPGISAFVGRSCRNPERPELTSAQDHYFGAGRCKSRENFTKYIEPGGPTSWVPRSVRSRAAVDAGYAPNDWQVGQTGKVVRRSSTLRSASRERSSISPA